MRFLYTLTFSTLLITAVCSSCKSQQNTAVISIGYHSDNCDDCNVLKSKMKGMNRKFLLAPIVFIKYDKTTAKSKLLAEKKLAKWGILDMAKRDDGLKYVILYDRESKEKLERIDYNDDSATIELKIRKALEKAKKD